ncbi:hypothetical protein AVEN_113661-1 [Araneus ventricosus]|uniref:Uncharacterized protein n=1 Tax=Araneus ventricosus TaxID=182803 RepID=A0A4Y2NS84_ARAVE|nr:hypothetical protein AVEN_113661-1 [Araneus ventricosus]
MPNSDGEDSPAKDINTSTMSVRSQRNPMDSLLKVSGVSAIELLINDIIDFNLDPDVSENLISVLQELSKIYVSKARDIKAGSRESIVEKVVAPFVKLYKDRETVHLSTIFDLKSSQIDISERQ